MKFQSEVTITVTFKPESEEGPSGDLPFTDVTQGAWYEDPSNMSTTTASSWAWHQICLHQT